MIRLEKMTPQKRGEMAAIFLTTCLFMLNRPWVTGRPWQNKIRDPFYTSISLSRAIGWQVSWGGELYTMQVYFSPVCPIFYALSWFSLLSAYLSIFLSLSFTFCTFSTLCDSSASSSSRFSFSTEPLFHLSLPFPIHPPFYLLLLSHSLCFSSPEVARLKTQGGFRFC